LRAVNYDYVLSIEHEDSLMSTDEGLQKGIDLLKTIIVREEKAKMWWA
jgi:sugar phosphate isomerase/epimerase